MTIRISPGADDMMLDERTIRDEYDRSIADALEHASAMAVRQIRRERLMAVLRSERAAALKPKEGLCARCYAIFPRTVLSDVSETDTPERVCVSCLYTNGGN